MISKTYAIYAVTFAFIVLDFITGVIKGAATEGIMSRRMREGLFHKIGAILCVVLGGLLDYAQTLLDFGSAVPIPPIPFAISICIYVILMEVSSIIENLCILDPELMPEKLCALFGIEKPSKKEASSDEHD